VTDLGTCTWPRDRLGEAVAELAHRSGLSTQATNLDSSPPTNLPRRRDFDRWMERIAASVACEAEAVSATYSAVGLLVRRASPAIIQLDDRYLVVLHTSPSRVVLLAPDGTQHRVRAISIVDLLRDRAAGTLELDAEIEALTLAPRRARRVRHVLASERLGARPVISAWVLRSEPTTPFWQQLRHDGVLDRVAVALTGHLGYSALWILSWYILGSGVLSGGIARGWFWGWALCLASMVLLRSIIAYTQGEASIRFAAILKRFLLVGAIARDQDDMAGEGISRNLAYVYESDALSTSGLRGLIGMVLTSLELLYAPFILAFGSGGVVHAFVLVAWLLLAVESGRRLVHRRMQWTEARFQTSSQTLDAMLGQRTRRVQGRLVSLLRDDDRKLEAYQQAAEDLDRRKHAVMVGISRGWLVIGTAAMAPALLWGGWTAASLAVSIGGILFAYQALLGLGRSLDQLAASIVAWKVIRPIFAAASHREPVGIPEAMALSIDPGGPLLEATDLTYQYPRRSKPAVTELSLRIDDGDKVLLEGHSGAGKSTLAQLLAGHRIPQSGGLSLGGLDPASIGTSEWRRRVALVPQFHQNHLLIGPLAFNLMLGRQWPPTQQDIDLAYAVCLELGLGRLLDEMPAGLWQMVGQTGWQLSHGERSRVFLARALLQDADILIVDESLSALDPEHVARAAKCVMERARSLVLIAHP